MAKAPARTAPRNQHRATSGPPTRGRGRPRDVRLDAAILISAGKQLEERGYAGMSMESVAAAAGTTVPSLRRRYQDKPALAAAVVDSLRIEALPASTAGPRNDALAILQNFQRNLQRPRAMASLGSILAEEHRNPELLERFRKRLVPPRRAMLCRALSDAISSGELPAELDVQAASNMLIGSFYARYLSGDQTPHDWAECVLNVIWPAGDSRT
jgi:AcrR family transcriptional regulator